MKHVPRFSALVLGSVFALVLAQAWTSQAQAPPEATSVALTPDEMRVFLAEARIVKTRRNGKGVTASQIATLSDGRVTHEAQVQTVDVARAFFQAGGRTEVNFRDSYKYNIAGYELARLLGMDNVPMSVERRVQGAIGAVTWWLDDVLMDEKERIKKNVRVPDQVRRGQQVQIMRVFDQLIQNVDRNQGNLVWDRSWKLWLVDHTQAFRLGKELTKLDDLASCDRSLFDALRRLTAEALKGAVGNSLTGPEIEAVMARRDLLVEHFDAQIAKRGEAAVLFALAR